ncbi:hypothetical protein SAMN04488128_102117 [Chitinophaga eiseniae]|uniref:Uncharacterized protein n=1 Tax=Chitinophaga eiseniae TaxID=634771 RepID=A0A1T4Q1H5_9BACT|nr:hypothetical protein [Chitinophaga eiseniae]SJZ97579.1 hypothetical protein SAMN04488128_102117 [Chitinophaga eiseniae]
MEKKFPVEYWLVAKPKRKLLIAFAIFLPLFALYAIWVHSYESALMALRIPGLVRMVVLLLPFVGVMLAIGHYLGGMWYRCEQLIFTTDSLLFVRRGKEVVFRRKNITRFKITEQTDKGIITSYFFTANGINYSVYTSGTAVMHDFIHQAFVHFFSLDSRVPVVAGARGVEVREYLLR